MIDTIGKLNQVSANLDKREAHLQKLIDKCTVDAKKEAKKKNKRGAMYHLKKKKMYEKELDGIFGKKANLDMQIMTLEGAATNREVLSAMQVGAKTLKATIKDSDMDEIDDVVDDIAEATQIADELSNAMSQPMGTQMDEDDLLADLAELEEEIDDDLVQSLGLDDMASVPTKTVDVSGVTDDSQKVEPDKVEPVKSKPVKEQSEEDKQLAELNALMGM